MKMDDLKEIYVVLIDSAVSEKNLPLLTKLYSVNEQNRRCINSKLKFLKCLLGLEGETFKTLPSLIEFFDRQMISSLPLEDKIKYAIDVGSPILLKSYENKLLDISRDDLLKIMCYGITHGSIPVIETLITSEYFTYRLLDVDGWSTDLTELSQKAWDLLECSFTNSFAGMNERFLGIITPIMDTEFFNKALLDQLRNSIQEGEILKAQVLLKLVMVRLKTRELNTLNLSTPPERNKMWWSTIALALSDVIKADNTQILQFIIDGLKELYDEFAQLVPLSELRYLWYDDHDKKGIMNLCHFYRSVSYMYGGMDVMIDSTDFSSISNLKAFTQCHPMKLE